MLVNLLKESKILLPLLRKMKKMYHLITGKIYYNKFINKYKKNKFNFNDFDHTIEFIISKNCSVSRLGDGELNMIFSDYSIGFQKHNIELSKRLLEILNNHKLSNHIVCMPGIFNNEMNLFTDDAKLFWYKFIKINGENIINIINKNNIYYETHITRPYIIYKDKSNCRKKFDKLKLIWDRKDLLIVEGENTRLGMGNDLFDNSNSIQRILCPSKNAFSVYDNILNISKQLGKNKLILIALGPTATILSYDLSSYGYQAIDIGHIDVEYEWFLLGTKEKVNLKNKYVNEVDIGGDEVEIAIDEVYNSQIVYRIN